MEKTSKDLPAGHPHNKAARACGRKWSKKEKVHIISRNKSVPAGSEGSNDTRWGEITYVDAVYAHK